MVDCRQMIKQLRAEHQAAAAKGTADAFGRLDTIMAELDVALREHIQDLTKEQMQGVINKLKGNVDLDAKDKELLRLWIVGDAEAYTQMENSFPDWLKELNRIMDAITSYAAAELGIEGIVKLRAILRDACRVLDDIFYFVEQKERVARFLDSTRDIDEDERQLLLRILEMKKETDVF
jgi:hypothetical protein